ncbi:hypothetical protein PNI0076_01215 [Streptococcus pneumoniae PNI0076]|nr:hypothetical protein PNI0006_01865 [Streptococcus pneumoniae PNI0006]ELU74023.1 hypothetical protein PNI0009_02294 [Streptococcus pneumoniae PNI0009]ELU77246.1 hypothetical protein PNI0010_01322 [Streptococcus pneumoniae PNI0010]ELU83536.1 hypothetical protein PNI0076_01215 [Streptococcus pneumoniae PNI0076]
MSCPFCSCTARLTCFIWKIPWLRSLRATSDADKPTERQAYGSIFPFLIRRVGLPSIKRFTK